MNGYGDALQSQIKHIVEQQTNGFRAIVYGHLSSYDPKTGRARWIVPSYTDDGVDFVLTSWAPLYTGFTGSIGVPMKPSADKAWGIQCCPIGGATKENPTNGELCVINMSERQYGVAIGGHVVANQINNPPNQSLNPGEIFIKGNGQQTMLFKANGDIDVTTPGQTNITSVGQINVTSTGKDASVSIVSNGENSPISVISGGNGSQINVISNQENSSIGITSNGGNSPIKISALGAGSSIDINSDQSNINLTSNGGAGAVSVVGNLIVSANVTIKDSLVVDGNNTTLGNINVDGISSTGPIFSTSSVTAGLGTPDQVDLQSHVHPYSGGNTLPPVPGT